jgi:hypothetical protein
LGRYGWKGTKCDVDIEGVFVVRGWIITCDPREAMLDDDLD